MPSVLTWTITELMGKLRSRALSAAEIVTAHLEQIAAHNVEGKGIRAVIEVNAEALLLAEALDREAAKGYWRGPLHGIPILVKDNLDTADTMQTTAGSIALSGHRAKEDATVVRRLREQGAIIIGKANLTEWANFLSDRMPNGYSSRGGQTQNPYGPGVFDVGGSSAGSGAGVAAGFAPAAIGTETSGSILSPASSNSLVGVKPTVGLVSRRGIIPIAMSQDTAGPMTRSVADAALLLAVMAGADARDVATLGVHIPSHAQWSNLSQGALRGARIGVPRDYDNELEDDEQIVYRKALADLERLGGTLVECALPTAFAGGIDVLIEEFPVALNAYLASVEPWLPVHSLADVMAFNSRHADKALRYGQAIFEMAAARAGDRLADGSYIRARLADLHTARTNGIDKACADHGLDAIAFANNLGAAIAAKAGYPSITIPAGYTNAGKPVGLTLTSGAFSERKLFELAYDFEQATSHRRPPVFTE
ncbi:amidase [Alicyclobacillus sacchari]|uniref:Amidase n=1 Tax=Alicyclobacillus sacchari TaxID=392010 RepID=A0A4V3HEN6_9BACL|nr:amidase family protein [Alicyclobacillus sacchari]TDY49661.1 amidase [Alicyclobacillus sacchari]GMA58436.1 amidase [Alicyclobacillus sacchari]